MRSQMPPQKRPTIQMTELFLRSSRNFRPKVEVRPERWDDLSQEKTKTRSEMGRAMNLKTHAVRLLTTGGTIEKTYSEEDGSLLNRQALLRDFFTSRLRLPTTELLIREIMAKDSLDMTESDRILIADAVKEAFLEKLPIVILHGTDTMDRTARVLNETFPSPPVAVVLTGSMRPAAMIETDALQNFTEALLAAQLLRPGVYISFHNQVFLAAEAYKNRQLSTFAAREPRADVRTSRRTI